MCGTYKTAVWKVNFVAVCLLGFSTAAPLAATSAGVIQGTQHVSPQGLSYYAFRGIPYAKPPTGDLRWQLPEPLPSFTSVYEAESFKSGCPQLTGQVETSEDCLYLDVYVPGNITGLYDNATEALEAWAREDDRNSSHSAEDNSRPVMIWIHGGAYHSGYSQGYTGWKVATEQNIVVVVIQYRLGALGFLSSGDDFLPGNYGLWDQLLALKWVKDNIRGFGGDVSMITIVGESAGASSVSQHTVSRHSSGLFHRAVMMSGTVEAYWCFRRNPRATFDRMSEVAGCGENSTSQESRLDCLMKVPADVIHSAAVATEAGDFVTFVPVIDGNFFPNDLYNLLRDEDYLSSVGFYDYDVLMGVLNNEGVITFTTLMALSPTVLATGRVPYQDIDDFLLDGLMLQEQGENHDPNSKDAVNYRYFYPRDPAESSVPLRTFFDLYTDSSFAVPAVKYLRNHARRDGMSQAGAVLTPTLTPTTALTQPPAPSPRQSKSYFYYFDWVPSLTRGSLFAGMPHGLDVDYLFGLTDASLAQYGPMTPNGFISQQEHDLSRMYGDMIGAFVRTGNPNNGISPSFNLGNQWLPYDVSKETFLRFSPTPSIDHHLRPSTTSLWIDLVPRLHSRWLQQTANGIPGPTATEYPGPTANGIPGQPANGIPGPTATEKTPAAERSQSEKLTDFNVTASEANAMLISLIIVSAVLLLLNLFLLVIFIRVCRRKTASKYEMKNMDRSHNKN